MEIKTEKELEQVCHECNQLDCICWMLQETINKFKEGKYKDDKGYDTTTVQTFGRKPSIGSVQDNENILSGKS